MDHANPYETDLDRNPANHAPLTPLGFLARAALAFPEHPAIIHGARRVSYADFYLRAKKLASALAGRGVKKGDRVAIYMGMVPELAIAMLACAKIGAPHSVVFGGFSAE